MKYPYIGEDKDNGNITLFTGDDEGIVIKNKISTLGDYCSDWAEFAFTNITAEYLANTYGEVKDEPHAEFIKALAVSGGFYCGDNDSSDYQFFSFDDDELYFWCRAEQARGYGEKQITIPQPPEGWNILDDNEDTSNDDEWPKVGDECVVTNEHDRALIYGHEVIGKKVNVLTTYKTDNIDMAVVNFDGCGYCFRVEMLQKPKTPGEELLDELSQYLDNGYSDSVDIEADKSAFKSFAVDLMGKYNITKKEAG